MVCLDYGDLGNTDLFVTKEWPMPTVKQESVVFGEMDLASSRGKKDCEIYQFKFPGTEDLFQHFMVQDQERRASFGNCYHEERTKILYFINGGGTFYTIPVDDNGHATEH